MNCGSWGDGHVFGRIEDISISVWSARLQVLNIAHLLASYYSPSVAGASNPIKSEHVCSPLHCPTQQGILRCSHEPRPMHRLSHCELAFRRSISKTVEVNSRNCRNTALVHTIRNSPGRKCLTSHLGPQEFALRCCVIILGTPQMAHWRATEPCEWPRSLLYGAYRGLPAAGVIRLIMQVTTAFRCHSRGTFIYLQDFLHAKFSFALET